MHFDGFVGLDLRGAIDVVWQWEEADKRQNCDSNTQAGKQIAAFDFGCSPRRFQKFVNGRYSRYDHSRHARHRKGSAERLQPIRFKHLIEKHNDSKRNHPAVDKGSDSVDSEHRTVASWEERIVLQFEP